MYQQDATASEGESSASSASAGGCSRARRSDQRTSSAVPRSVGSQGEQRLALLALLLAERDALAAERARPPLMLLDDVMSELDLARRELLAGELRRGGQSVVTATELEHVPGWDGADVTLVAVP